MIKSQRQRIDDLQKTIEKLNNNNNNITKPKISDNTKLFKQLTNIRRKYETKCNEYNLLNDKLIKEVNKSNSFQINNQKLIDNLSNLEKENKKLRKQVLINNKKIIKNINIATNNNNNDNNNNENE